MSEFKGTKGEWHANGLEVRAESGLILANVYKHLSINQTKKEAEANAKLISCAPEMLEELQYIVDNYTIGVTDKYRLEKLIKKATN